MVRGRGAGLAFARSLGAEGIADQRNDVVPGAERRCEIGFDQGSIRAIQQTAASRERPQRVDKPAQPAVMGLQHIAQDGRPDAAYQVDDLDSEDVPFARQGGRIVV